MLLSIATWALGGTLADKALQVALGSALAAEILGVLPPGDERSDAHTAEGAGARGDSTPTSSFPSRRRGKS